MRVKYLKAPYSRKYRVTKQKCTPRDPKKVLWFHTSNFFKKMQQEFGVWDTQVAFKRALEEYGVEEFHDVLGCMNCKWRERTLFIVASLDITVPTHFTNVLLGVFIVLPSLSWDCRFLVVQLLLYYLYYLKS